MNILTQEEITHKLKSMKVGLGEKCLPVKFFSVIVPNPDYDPENFSQEIEDSEEYVDILKMITEGKVHFGYDFDAKTTLKRYGIKENSELWLKNHSKICETKTIPYAFAAGSAYHEDGTRDYCSKQVIDTLNDIAQKHGGIYEIV